MNIEHKKITYNIHLLTFENQMDITSTFLRFQEHYESPNFRGKTFSLEEFKKWYIENSPGGKKTGEFTYYSDWNGFNIPSYVLKPFYAGEFDLLSDSEKQLLRIFKDEKEVFYVIGVHKEAKKSKELLNHEIAHALFYTNENYKSEVLGLLSRFNVEALKEEIKLLGYHDDVLEDEAHAFSVDSGRDLEAEIPEELSAELQKIYKKYL